MTGPNPLSVFLSILRSRRVRPPRPAGTATFHSGALDPVLDAVAEGGVPALGDHVNPAAYIAVASRIDPDTLTRTGALAFWLNLYNAGALDLARRAAADSQDTVLRVPGGFNRPFVTLGDESLSLDEIEHGKIRRFRDPRIHAALACGSASCPTLRGVAYTGEDLDAELDDQLRSFLAAGAAERDTAQNVLRLSRVFLWYGADFVRPHRMPTLLPARRSKIRDAVAPWLSTPIAEWVATEHPRVQFQPYDWGLRCTVRRPGVES
jgi:hypothetical protein